MRIPMRTAGHRTMVQRNGGRRTNRHREAGQAGLFVVLNLTLLFAVLSLVVDLGWSYYRRQAAQAAADSAALAAATAAQLNGYTCGAGGVTCGTETPCAYPNVSPPTSNYHTGCLYAGANGFYNTGGQTVTMTGNTTAPPGTSGNVPTYWVKAKVSESGSNRFARFAGIRAFTINASAIAGINVTPPGGCIYVLASTGAGALSVSGSSSVTTACVVRINSSSVGALSLNGGASLYTPAIDINGGTASIPNNAIVTPTPNTAGGPVTDPLASLPMPTVGACDFIDYKVSGGANVTINPGVYCGGITLVGSSTLNLNPGTFIMNGGGMSLSSGATVRGTGVTFFNTGQFGRTAGAIGLNGSASVQLSAPTSGIYQGMLFVQDRNITYTGTNNILGTSTSVFTGTLYFPSTAVNYTGNSTGTFTAIIAKTLQFSGNSNIKNDPSGNYTGLGGRSSALIQ